MSTPYARSMTEVAQIQLYEKLHEGKTVGQFVQDLVNKEVDGMIAAHGNHPSFPRARWEARRDIAKSVKGFDDYKHLVPDAMRVTYIPHSYTRGASTWYLFYIPHVGVRPFRVLAYMPSSFKGTRLVWLDEVHMAREVDGA